MCSEMNFKSTCKAKLLRTNFTFVNLVFHFSFDVILKTTRLTKSLTTGMTRKHHITLVIFYVVL